MKYPYSELNPQYVFRNFVVGPCNRFAHSASKAVAEKPAEMYNPLFLYGGVGLGKTHLMQAVGHHALSLHRGKLRAAYLSTESFTNLLISAIQKRTTEEFRHTFRNTDVLLIDDIHFIAGKDATQEEFFHTFNALYDRKKQIVISSDRPPKEIPTLEERLISRFEWGVVAALESPDLDTRIAILKKKAESCRIPVPTELLELIAQQISSNIRELEGALTRLVATAGMRGEPLSIGLAKEVLGELVRHNARDDITLEMIRRVSAKFFGIKESHISSQIRSRSVALPRQIGMYLCRQLTSASLAEIGAAFGKKDHTTVLYACRKIEGLMRTDKEQASVIRGLRKEVESKAAGDDF